ncbi:polynucleotide phosphorylase (PNPase) [Petrocella atlantisensis]|uniref:Polyribonucleotide nucleotidyltransferase n=1 Tax=Petrocella atlantisensis TaxID=2173034 RepID=A0A3P7RSD4_9FIRM|nr:polyribonucleotide nucleotidyltransferase [Petrocella atlantisensis]VDN45926.1 polynucleotide phosphorylase (PNPase) [Petrocella atlantisensis]
MSRIYSMELSGRTLSVEIGKMAQLASGACLISYGETVVLSTATASEKPREGIDFFPLSVDYEEKLYSVGKIPGGFIKREGRPTENSILTSRIIDRPIRPLFPKDYRNECTIVNTVMAVDQDCMPEVVAAIGTSIALSISHIPFMGPTASTYVGLVNGEFVFNPTSAQREASDMVLNVVSTEEKVTMIEAEANEVSEDVMIEAIAKAHALNQEVCAWIKDIQLKEGKPKQAYTDASVPAEIMTALKDLIGDARIEEAVYVEDKSERFARIDALKEEMLAIIEADESKAAWKSWLDEAFYQYQKKTVRRLILKEHKRPDGRGIDEIRTLSAEIDILPRVHGSALFSRGETQALTITTLAPLSDRQRVDALDELTEDKRYMHHYNFPSYSVGESRPSRGPGRREIGHGALAEKALLPVLPSENEFPYAIRTVSEILSSNGSTSQASICASSLSLMAAGVPLKAPVAGISCGLVTGDDEKDFILLTDIQGLEDFFGDMDFKVAGTEKGITAIQLDMKLLGISQEIIEGAIHQTKKARMVILNDVMNKTISEGRTELAPTAPKIIQTQINPEKIGEVVGPRGKVINKIIEDTGVSIDIEDDGRVFICGVDMEAANEAKRIVETIANGVQVGAIYEGKVVRITTFGAFVELIPGKDGLVHISKIAKERVTKVEDVLSEGQIVKVKVTEVDAQGRINLSMKALLED